MTHCSAKAASLILSLFGTLGTTVAYGQVNSENQVTIQQTLTEVQKALAEAQAQVIKTGMPPLKSVTLDLQTDVTRGVDGKIKILIFSFGGSWEKEKSNELELVLAPPKVTARTEVANKPTLSEELVQAIVDASRGVQEARTTEPRLELSQLKIETQFVVTTGIKPGLEFKITPVSGDLSGDLKKKAIHKITLQFEFPKP